MGQGGIGREFGLRWIRSIIFTHHNLASLPIISGRQDAEGTLQGRDIAPL